jgi:pyruvate,orthophosphate dikinase
MKIVDKYRKLGVRTNADTPQDAKIARVRRRGHRPVPHRAHVLRRGFRRAAVRAAQDDLASKTRDGAPQKAPRRAVSASSRTTSRPRSKRWTACRSPSGCWTRRCTSSCRSIPRPGRAGQAAGHQAGRGSRSAASLHETNPMMGHRGVRLGITYPEVTEMQIKAIFESAAELIKAGKNAQARADGPGHLRRGRAGRDQGDLRPRAEGGRRAVGHRRCPACTAR